MSPSSTVNVNSNEVKHFDKFAGSWWDEEGPFKTLHDINPIRAQFIEETVDVNNQQILDIGCGAGLLTEVLARRGAEIIGIDPASEVLKEARAHAETANLDIHYESASAEAYLAQNTKRFDIITCMELLEHVPDPEALLETLSKLLKPQGYLFVSTLNRTLKSYLLAILGAEYLLNIIPRGTHHYGQFIKPLELDRACRKAGLHLEKIKGFSYNPLTRRSRLTSDLSINYLACLRKI